MKSIKFLDLYLFEGIPENATRHYAVDIQAFDAGRGTRDGIYVNDESLSRDISSILPDYNEICYEYDDELGRMVTIIK